MVLEVSVDENTSHIDYKVFAEGHKNRMLDRYGEDKFLIVKFKQNLSSDIVRTVLQKGVGISNCEYQFLGCSSSGLKERTCYLYKGSVSEVNLVLAECGSFLSIKSKSALLKRIGLLFSAAVPTGIDIPDERIFEEADVESVNGNFTDGCGTVSMELAARIMRSSCKGLPADGRYLPSVYQVRYQGCKGVVMVDPKLKGESLVIRPSMKKFSSGSKPFTELWLCDHSRPYTFGHINRQFIMLLSSLGVKDEVFLRIQKRHFHLLQTVKHDPTSAFQLLQFDNQPERAFRCFKGERQSEKDLLSLRKKLVSQLDKLRLLVPDSRHVFGVCDPTGKLQYGQCFFRYTEHGHPKTLHGAVVVAKNPCYLLGDIRVLKCVPVPELEHLVDCIVFPINGKRPHPSEIAGSDLDGDQYFVCWDEGLLVLQTQEPYHYPSVTAPQTTSEVTRSVLIDYFASYKNSMGKIDHYYREWANKKGAGCSECQHLGMLFSRSVDASKTGDQVVIPKRLIPDSLESPETLHVWEEMDKRASEIKMVLTVSDETNKIKSKKIEEEFVWTVLIDKFPNLSEYQLFRFLLRWCSHAFSNVDEGYHKLENFAKYLNFSEFTVDQQVEAIDAGIPMNIITNALNKSDLFPPSLLQKFLYNDIHQAWKFYLNSTSASFNWKNFLQGVQDHPESLVVIEISDDNINGVTFVLHFLEPPMLGEGLSVGAGSIAVYFSSSNYNLDEQRIVGSRFTLDLTEHTLQLYHGKSKSGTFVWMGSGSKMSDQEIQISVDLTRFKRDILDKEKHPKVKKESVSRIEVFVKSQSQDPVYLDVVETLDPDICEGILQEEFEEVPKDSDREEEYSEFIDKLLKDPWSLQHAMHLLLKCSGSGNPCPFQSVLGTIVAEEGHPVPEAFGAFQELLKIMVVKFCDRKLSGQAVDCLHVIIDTLSRYFTSPTDALQLLSNVSRLHHSALASFTLDKVLTNISVFAETDLFKVASSWQLWYFIESPISFKLAECFYSLLCSKWSEQSDESCTEKDQFDTKNHIQNVAWQYGCHFTIALLQNLMMEMSTHDNASNQLEKMKAYCIQTSSEDRSFGEKDNAACMIGFSRTAAGIASHKFTQGSYVAISIMERIVSGGSVTSLPAAVGVITRISRQPADLLVEVEKPVPQCLKRSAKLQKGHWQLSIIANITGYKRALKALKMLVQNPLSTALSSSLIQSGDCPLLESDAVPCSAIANTMPLNKDQREAVEAALQRKITLVHGPPGTGKTHVACEIIKHQVSMNSSNTILVAAETNLAVDNLCEKLLPLGIRVVRIGRLDQISHTIRRVSLESQVEQKRIAEGKDKSSSLFLNSRMVRQVLRAAQVVAATCTGAGDSALEGMTFPFVIIDEATQVTEPTSLVPLVHGCQQLVLIGDPEQLGPSNQAAVKQNVAYFQVKFSLSESLFHRLNKIMPSFFLSEQHRMHHMLAAFPSRKFYGSKLRTASSCINRELVKHIPLLESSSLSVFLDICQEQHSREKRIGTSFHNVPEAGEVIRVIKYLIECQISSQEIAVLTPYSGQVRAVREALGQDRLSHVKVYTIDGFQGREVDYVVFTTVRCNHHGDLGFTDDKYRMNVLLTRAKHGIIGIGCRETLSSYSELWKEWLKDIKICRTVDCRSEDQHKHFEGRHRRPGQRSGRVRSSHDQNHSRSCSKANDYKVSEEGCGNVSSGLCASSRQGRRNSRGGPSRGRGGEGGMSWQRRNEQGYYRGRNVSNNRHGRGNDHTRRASRGGSNCRENKEDKYTSQNGAQK